MKKFIHTYGYVIIATIVLAAIVAINVVVAIEQYEECRADGNGWFYCWMSLDD